MLTQLTYETNKASNTVTLYWNGKDLHELGVQAKRVVTQIIKSQPETVLKTISIHTPNHELVLSHQY